MPISACVYAVCLQSVLFVIFCSAGEPLQSGHTSLELRSKLLERVKEDRESIEKMSSKLSQLQNLNKE